MVWQVLIAMVLVAFGAVLAATLIIMPRTGYTCKVCSSISCQDFLGWQCRYSPIFRLHCFVYLAIFPIPTLLRACSDVSMWLCGKGHVALSRFSSAFSLSQARLY